MFVPRHARIDEGQQNIVSVTNQTTKGSLCRDMSFPVPQIQQSHLGCEINGYRTNGWYETFKAISTPPPLTVYSIIAHFPTRAANFRVYLVKKTRSNMHFH